LKNIITTLDALHGNLVELRRLKEFVLEERTIVTSSVANSTRSATVILSSAMESSLKTSQANSSKKNVVAKDSIDSPGILGSQKEKFELKKRNLNVHLDPSKLIDEAQIVAPARDYCEVIIKTYDHIEKFVMHRILCEKRNVSFDSLCLSNTLGSTPMQCSAIIHYKVCRQNYSWPRF
jgi:hypothetical protein